MSYLVPTLLLLISFYLFKKQKGLHQLPILFIPLVEPKLALFPFLYLSVDFVFGGKKKVTLLFLVISIIVLLVRWKPFFGQTIFVRDYEAQQEVIRETQLYPSIPIARMFHNKARIILDKFMFNFFSLTDPNNYFFGFAPRQIITNQNLIKFPFLAIIFVLYGVFLVNKSDEKKFIISSFFAGTISLSFLTLFDRNDFILWLPISLTFIYGANLLIKKINYSFWISLLFIITTIPELLRIIVNISK